MFAHLGGENLPTLIRTWYATSCALFCVTQPQLPRFVPASHTDKTRKRERPAIGARTAAGYLFFDDSRIPRYVHCCQQATSGRLGWSLFSRGQPYNVVLTHLSADFDSLAAAVGVAKLWNMDDPEVRARARLLGGCGAFVVSFAPLRAHLEADKVKPPFSNNTLVSCRCFV